MLLALIANFATYAASAPYKYPIAFSHNERNAIRCVRFHPILNRSGRKGTTAPCNYADSIVSRIYFCHRVISLLDCARGVYSLKNTTAASASRARNGSQVFRG